MRLARNLGNDRFIGLEYYADFGRIGDFLPVQQQSQQLFAVTDFKVNTVDVELGVGYGFTPGSDGLVVKAIIGYGFPVPGKSDEGGSSPNTPLAIGGLTIFVRHPRARGGAERRAESGPSFGPRQSITKSYTESVICARLRLARGESRKERLTRPHAHAVAIGVLAKPTP